MKHLKEYNDTDVKEGDYVVFLDSYDEDFVKKNYPYQVEEVDEKNNRAWIKCDDGELKSFRAKNSQVYMKITKEEAEMLFPQYKFNL